MTIPPDHGPLSDEELDELDQLLLDAAGIEESMDVSTLDGFLTAIVCGPKTIMPSEWMRWVWDMERGEEAPKLESHAQAQHIVGLLMRHMNDIARTLRETPDRYQPLLMENPNHGDPIPILDECCSGFMKGMQLDSEGWAPVVVGKPDWISTIMLYGTEEGWEALKKKDLSLERHRALAAGLAATVRKIHALWLEQREGQVAEGKSACPRSRVEAPLTHGTRGGGQAARGNALPEKPSAVLTAALSWDEPRTGDGPRSSVDADVA